METVKFYGCVTVLKCELKYVEDRLNESLKNFAVVAERDGTREDILAISNGCSPMFAEYCEEHQMYSTIIFEFEPDESSRHVVSDLMVDSLISTFTEYGQLF